MVDVILENIELRLSSQDVVLQRSDGILVINEALSVSAVILGVGCLDKGELGI